MQGDSSDEEDPLYALLGDLALRRLDQRLREDFGCFEPDDLLGISVADFGAIGLKQLERERLTAWQQRRRHTLASASSATSTHYFPPLAANVSTSTPIEKTSSRGEQRSADEIQAAVAELEQALHEEIGDSDSIGFDRREFVDLAAEFGVQRAKAFAAAADMGFGDDDYLAHPFPLWFVKRSKVRGAVMKAEFRDILAGLFGSLTESSRSRMVDRRRRRPSMLLLQKELAQYRAVSAVVGGDGSDSESRGANPMGTHSTSTSTFIETSREKRSADEIQAAVAEFEQALHEEIGDSDSIGFDRREFVDLSGRVWRPARKGFCSGRGHGLW